MKKKKEALNSLKMIAECLEKTIKEKVDKIISQVNNCENLIKESDRNSKELQTKFFEILNDIDNETTLIEKRVKTFAPDGGYHPTELDIQIQEWAGLTINHEINNPLSIVKGRVQALKLIYSKEDVDKEYLIEKLSKIKSESERISVIINKFMNAKDISVIEYQGHEMMIDLKKL